VKSGGGKEAKKKSTLLGKRARGVACRRKRGVGKKGETAGDCPTYGRKRKKRGLKIPARGVDEKKVTSGIGGGRRDKRGRTDIG